MTYPTLPESFERGSLPLEAIWHDVCAELTDYRYKSRSHHNRKTYNIGCHGPLCRKAVREYASRRNSASPRPEYVLLNPILMYFKSEAEKRIAAHEAQTLERLIS